MLTLAAADTLAAVASAAAQVTCTVMGMELSGTAPSLVETYKVLYQGQLAVAAATIYTAPASTVGFVRSIMVVNNDSVTRTFQLFRGGLVAANAITPVFTLPAGGTAVYEDGQGWMFYTGSGPVMSQIGVQLNDIHSGYSEYQAISNPIAPAADTLRWYARKIAGRMVPKWVPPSGVDYAVQAALYGNRVYMFSPMNAAVGTGSNPFGPLWTSNGTVSHPTPATTAPAISNQMKRTRYANIITTTNQQLGPRCNTVTEQQFWRGNAAGLGGFFFFARFVVDLIPAATVRLFAGLTNTATGSVVISDTVLNDTCGLWHDTTDGLSTFNFVTRNAATTTKQAIALSNAIAAGNSYDFYIYCKPNDTTIYWRLDDVVNNVTYEGSQTLTLPTSTAFLQPQVQMSNGTANIVATTVAIGVVGIYVESDN